MGLGRARAVDDLGVPSRIFPQWLRCTGCDRLAPLTNFEYTNTHPYRTDEARFEHVNCPGRGRTPGSKGRARRPAVPARYLLACVNGHLDEFPYDWWVHRGMPCDKADRPALKMVDRALGKGSSATIECASCGHRRPMNEAQGESARGKLPKCRGRHPHLNAFETTACTMPVRLMLVGASNLWFPATQSIIVMPSTDAEQKSTRADALIRALADKLEKYRDSLDFVRDLLEGKGTALESLTDGELREAIDLALDPPDVEEQSPGAPDPIDLLVPEWRYLQHDPSGPYHDDESGLMLSPRERHADLRPEIARVLAVDKLRKVNAMVGFTRIDDMDRVDDQRGRLVTLTRDHRPTWAVATEDRGEGILLQLDESLVAPWESQVEDSTLWVAHRDAHRRNFERRFSETARIVDPDDWFPSARYWLVHTFAHILIREMAMQCGYSAASLTERVYAWPAAGDREPAAGLLICTTASDSDGTLGGLVQLSDKDRLHRVVSAALLRARRCSSDPVCAHRTPRDPEDFLHGAACHCCAMASETSCERANRFLDRRFLVNLPGGDGLGFFG